MYNMYTNMYRNNLHNNMNYNNMNRQGRSEINVVGTGTEYASPDLAVITLDITTIDTDPTKTEISNMGKVDNILELLKEVGVKAKDIEVRPQVITPILDEQGVVLKYEATTFITVTFYDLVLIGEFYYNIKGREINIDQIILTTQNINQYYYRALEKAVKSAYRKAEIMSEGMEGSLRRDPIIFTETSSLSTIIEEVVNTNVEQLEDIELSTIVIVASVEGKFVVEN